MKQSSFLIIAILSLLLTNCKKQEMEFYESGRYVQFTAAVTDTLTLSFFFYAGKPSVDMSLPVRMVGQMPSGNLSYQLKVDPQVTTAQAKHYTIPGSFTFRQGLATDSAVITINNSAELAQQQVLLALEITATDDLIPGQTNYIRKIIKINDMVSKPAWWAGTIETGYLGVYTEKKYRTFMAATGVGALNEYSPALQRELILQFKYYLIEMRDAGTPVLESDGTDMLSTVPIIG
ncbi:MAG: DUF4843 domain-containing protein [Candidatus Pseudobacter hemicellulosilyticus]|uniref:DUF4843 domain-containing protein n=1 Tax=Candidatus Pseudobacter hemicellulosilyticus TaxID=3121375 RepID=A0AAJ5WTV8_9BACT|nr:MAG: DUF4843 domain-containing protein [Pseudobacter sp.]